MAGILLVLANAIHASWGTHPYAMSAITHFVPYILIYVLLPVYFLYYLCKYVNGRKWDLNEKGWTRPSSIENFW